jgi:hypothetical protein
MKRPLIKRLVLGCGIVLLMALAAFGWYMHLLMQAFDMDNEDCTQLRSPDGRYVATLAYRNGMTFGFYFVCLQPAAGWHPLQPGDPIPQDEVAEVAAEGLDSLTWVGSHKLVVHYEKDTGNDKTEFVLQQKAWRDVRIAYRGS